MSERFRTAEVLIGDSGPTSDGSTKTGTAARCFKKFQLQYVRKIYVPRSQNPSYFSVGSVFGAYRSAWFGTGFATSKKAWLIVKHAGQREAERNRLPVRQQDEAYALNLFEQYVAHWVTKPFPKPIAVELKVGPHKDLPLTGSLDDLSVYPTYGLCIGECKTTAGDISSSIKEYEFHVQTLQYQALYLLDPNGAAKHGFVDGTMLDVTHKPDGKGKKPAFARAFIEMPRPAVKTFITSSAALMRAANAIKWDSSPVRSYQCTYQAGRARVDCEYKQLCLRGRGAAGKFVLENGASLSSHKPTEGKEKMPWE